jgi:Mrp family chromosome partitioning ATPase
MATEAEKGLVLHFVAASVGEGASTLSAEFARVAARVAGVRVLLIDADRQQLTTASKFGCPTDLGIIDRIQSNEQLAAELVTSSDYSQLQIGVLFGNRSSPPSRKDVRSLYERLRSAYDLTIVDCPAIFSDRYFDLGPEATDGIVMVVQAERSRPETIRQAKLLVEDAGGKFVGAILNRRRTYIPSFLYRLL